MQRVQKIMSNAGYCSRRKAEEFIAAGKVKVNGKTISLGDQAGEQDTITINGKPLKKEPKLYVVFHKPRGCVTALTDRRLRTIMDFIKIKERVFPVGRLDYNTTGLLLLTNDGDWANRITHPRYEVRKTYVVRVHKPFGYRSITKVEKGFAVEGRKTAPAKVRKLGPDLFELTIHEGRNRIVRKMMEELGFKVIELHRVRIGKLALGELKEGKYKVYRRAPII